MSAGSTLSSNIMTDKAKILAFAGSTRSDAYNKKLIRVAARNTEAAGAEVTVIDLKDYAMPLYDGDLETNSGIPANAMALRPLFLAHQGLLLACPEYNGSISAVLKNTIDWLSRPVPDGKPLDCFQDKVVSLMSASPGRLGGLRGLVHVRAILGNIGCIVLPEQVAIGEAHHAFDEHGHLQNEHQRHSIENLAAKIVAVTNNLSV